MGLNYDNREGLRKQGIPDSRIDQNINHLGKMLRQHFDEQVLLYLDEEIINHLADSIFLENNGPTINRFNDFSFLTAPAYKAFEGFLFQIARDLNLLPGRDNDQVGGYYDPVKVDKEIDRIIKELEKKTGGSLKKDHKDSIKANVTAMRLFLKVYRHTPAHFRGQPLKTKEMARQNIHRIYGTIRDTVIVLQEAGMLPKPNLPPK